MPSGFKTFGEEEFDRVFMKETEIIDNFVGNRLWTWGSGVAGALGDGTTVNKSSPVTTAGGGVNWKQVEITGTNGMGIGVKTDGTLWTWGYNINGQLGDGTTTSRSSPGTTAGGGTNWKQASIGPLFMAAVKTDGTLWTWGSNTPGNLGNGNTTARSSPGTTSGGGTTWKQVSCGDGFTAAIKTDGTLWTWGVNTGVGSVGVLGDGTTTNRSSPGTTAGGGTNWRQVECGDENTAAIKTDGTLWTWGTAIYGALGDGQTAANISSPAQTAGAGTNWKQVSVGYRAMAAVKTDGTLWTWGSALTGAMGDGTTTARSSPGTVVGNSTWKQVSVGNGRKMAIGD